MANYIYRDPKSTSAINFQEKDITSTNSVLITDLSIWYDRKFNLLLKSLRKKRLNFLIYFSVQIVTLMILISATRFQMKKSSTDFQQRRSIQSFMSSNF